MQLFIRRIWETKRGRRIAALSAFYALLALTHLLPLDYRLTRGEMGLRAVARTVHGFSEFIVFVAQVMAGGPSPPGTFIGLVVAGPLVALLLTWLWKAGDEGRAIAVFLAVSNLAFGAAAVYADALLVGDPVHDCSVSPADQMALEVVSCPELGWNPERLVFLIASTDGEATWGQVTHVGPVSQSTGCGRLGTHDQSFHWYWLEWELAVTHDGGQTWTTWEINDIYPEWRCCEQRLISSVDFADPSSGTMTGFFGVGKPDRLISTDGGATWMEP